MKIKYILFILFTSYSAASVAAFSEEENSQLASINQKSSKILPRGNEVFRRDAPVTTAPDTHLFLVARVMLNRPLRELSTTATYLHIASL
ncbi:hypothetical protein DXG82_16455 [Salmonella enterica]|nr:hypothetical protein [Salmonella enterica]